jgi:hypothetical protein
MVDGAAGGRWTYLGELRRRSCGLGKQIGGGTVEPWQERDLKTVVAWTMEWRQERVREWRKDEISEGEGESRVLNFSRED